jgi:hypothetical protein
MPYDLSRFPQDNMKKLEVKDYVDVKKQGGKAHMGRFCSEIVTKYTFMHVALVSIRLTRKPGLPRHGKWQNGKCMLWMTWEGRRCPNPAERNPAQGGTPSIERK